MARREIPRSASETRDPDRSVCFFRHLDRRTAGKKKGEKREKKERNKGGQRPPRRARLCDSRSVRQTASRRSSEAGRYVGQVRNNYTVLVPLAPLLRAWLASSLIFHANFHVSRTSNLRTYSRARVREREGESVFDLEDQKSVNFIRHWKQK